MPPPQSMLPPNHVQNAVSNHTALTTPIDRLIGHPNYATWKPAMKAVLNRDLDVWRVVSGQHIKTSQPSPHPTLYPQNIPQQQPQTIVEPHVYDAKNELAYDAIVLSIDPNIQRHIQPFKNDGKAAWEELERLFDHPGRLKLRQLLFQETHMQVAESVGNYIARKLTLVKRLHDLGAGEMTDDAIADLVLMDVEPRFQPVQEEMRRRPWYRFDDVQKALLGFEERERKIRARENEAATAAAVAAGTLPHPGVALNNVGLGGLEARGLKRIADDPIPIAPAAKEELTQNGDLQSPVADMGTPAKKQRMHPSRGRQSGKKTGTSPQSANAILASPGTPTANNIGGNPTPSPAMRPFRCLFSFAGCVQSFASKNEWKRHINHIHLQLWYWRCDFPTCANRKAFFNRKDLFGQHLKRMHESALATESCADIQERCKKERRKPPDASTCGFCKKTFEGQGSWETLVDHVGDHYAQGTKWEDWKSDEGFEEWALREGVVRKGKDGRYTQDERGLFPDGS